MRADQVAIAGSYDRLLRPTTFKRIAFFLSFDFLIIFISLFLSFFIRFEFTMPAHYLVMYLSALPFCVCIKLIMIVVCKGYRISWRYFCLNDLTNIVIALTVSSLILYALVKTISVFRFGVSMQGFPRSIFLLDWLISLFLHSGLRSLKRLFLEHIKNGKKYGKKTLIIGAGNTGDIIIRDMKRQGYEKFYPVGILDDNRNKAGTFMHGVKVLGTTDVLHDAVSRYGVMTINYYSYSIIKPSAFEKIV